MDCPLRIGSSFRLCDTSPVYIVDAIESNYIKAHVVNDPNIVVHLEQRSDGWRIMRSPEIINRLYRQTLPVGIRRPQAIYPLDPLNPLALPETTHEIYSHLTPAELTPNTIVNHHTRRIYNEEWNRRLRKTYPTLVHLKPSYMPTYDYYHLLKNLESLDDDDLEHILENPSQEIVDEAMVDGFLDVLRWAAREHELYPNSTNQSEVIFNGDLVMIIWLAVHAGMIFDRGDIKLANPIIREWLQKHPEYVTDDAFDSSSDESSS